MAFFTYNDIKSIEEMIVTEGFNKEVIIDSASDNFNGKSLFLAHSPMDEEYLVGAISFFFGFNCNPYVKKSTSNKNKSTYDVANDYKTIIKACPKVVVLVSPESIDSQWIPWKLGYAEAIKGWDSVALLPIRDEYDVEEWINDGYLGIYPRVVHQYGDWVVEDPRDKNHWKLYRWLTM
ncbi:MAG: hypothetical protein AB1782_05485 [Cyanobacteriota bacterium]